MSKNAQTILKQVLELPALERAAIVDSVLSSLDMPDPALDKIWAEEAEKRIAAFDAGRIKAIDEEEVFAEMDRL